MSFKNLSQNGDQQEVRGKNPGKRGCQQTAMASAPVLRTEPVHVPVPVPEPEQRMLLGCAVRSLSVNGRLCFMVVKEMSVWYILSIKGHGHPMVHKIIGIHWENSSCQFHVRKARNLHIRVFSVAWRQG